MKVKRYDICVCDDHADDVETEDGKYVLSGDYDKLRAELDAAKTKIESMQEYYIYWSVLYETLRQISVQPCDPSRHNADGSVCSPCHAKSILKCEELRNLDEVQNE